MAAKQHELSPVGPVVAVIDDDLAVRNSLKFSLELEGLTIRSYASGWELLDAGNLDSCDCFVIDQKIPGMTGLELVTTLRRRDISAPVILITSHPNRSLREQAVRAEVPIVEKPLLGNVLLDKIRDVVRGRTH